jgi:rfaE bifunctional protein nucleotidyltransferase chain/domain
MTKLESIKSKIIGREELLRKLAVWRFKDQTIVFTNGCFDILHKGHATYLAEAAALGDVLIVGLNSDSSVKKLGKGANRPIQDEESRAFILASFHYISNIIIFEEDTPLELIKTIQPDVLVKGGDWKPEQIAGYDVVMAKGGKVVVLDFIPGFSTSSIVQKIKDNG